MDPTTKLLFFASPKPSIPMVQFSSTIDAVNGSATGLGSYYGSTGTTSQSTYRHGSFTGSCFFEWTVGSSNWANNSGFAGIMDLTHWNATPNYNSSTGKRMMMYFGNNYSYGETTGTTLLYGNGITFTAGDVCGCVYNNTTGKLAYYKNGVLGPVFQNTGFIGIAKYPAVSQWTSNLSSIMETTPSSYVSSYVYP